MKSMLFFVSLNLFASVSQIETLELAKKYCVPENVIQISENEVKLKNNKESSACVERVYSDISQQKDRFYEDKKSYNRVFVDPASSTTCTISLDKKTQEKTLACKFNSSAR